MKNLTQQLSEFVTETRFEDLPQAVVHETKRLLLDSIGCALAGKETQKGGLSVRLAKELAGPGESSVIGTTGRVSCTNAAFANGELMNALDFDALLASAIHVSFLLSPALAVGESRSASGRELILAIVMGFELTSRVLAGLSPMNKYVADKEEKGKLTRPAVYGYSVNAFGAAASAGKILKLDAGEMANALGLAGYNAPMQATAQWHHSGSNSLLKYASAGWMAQEGTMAALLAEIGYTGDVSVLDGDYSFWRFAGSKDWSPEVVISGIGKEWYTSKARYKSYPCCGIIQTALDCFTSLIQENNFTPEDIEQVKVWLGPLSQMPLLKNRRIKNEIHAQFSVAYLFSVLPYRIPPGRAWQEPSTLRNPAITDFMSKVSTAIHPDYGNEIIEKGANQQLAKVEVIARGRKYSQERTRAKGADTSDEDVVEKFRRNVSGILSEQKSQELLSIIWELEKIDKVSLLMEKVAGDGN